MNKKARWPDNILKRLHNSEDNSFRIWNQDEHVLEWWEEKSIEKQRRRSGLGHLPDSGGNIMAGGMYGYKWNWVTCVYWWWCLILLVTANRCSIMNSTQIQPNGAKQIRQQFTVQIDNDRKRTTKATIKFLKAKKFDILQSPSRSPDRSQHDVMFTYWN